MKAISTENQENQDIAYYCNGLNPMCSGKVGCYKYAGAELNESIICTHTLNPAYAFYGTCADPEAEVPKRFKYVAHNDANIRYFEDWD